MLARVQRGELRPWEYNLEILDRLPVSEATVNEFLDGVALDPGARALVEFCAGRGFPFRILSDGFDRNLDRLQQIHALPFAYDANRLRYENDSWRIEAGHPDPTCSCGTGTCKRGRIVAFRRAHPGTLAVHIGDGRVSDRCGAREADLVFAKHTLADVLGEEGIAFEPFETLLDVVACLERRFF
jgi:2-hydroxy-3-keto-5-methylthiopentenyl-1-phosphate phosphatase